MVHVEIGPEQVLKLLTSTIVIFKKIKKKEGCFMSRKRLCRGIKRITTVIVVVGLFIGMGKRLVNSIKYPELVSSTAAYHAVYGNDNHRLKDLNRIAKSMGYKDFNDYRVKTW